MLRGLGQQFGAGGTDAIESAQFWQVPAIRHAGGIEALAALGKVNDVMQNAKMRLFGV